MHKLWTAFALAGSYQKILFGLFIIKTKFALFLFDLLLLIYTIINVLNNVLFGLFIFLTICLLNLENITLFKLFLWLGNTLADFRDIKTQLA